MRSHGEILDVEFQRKGWCIFGMAYKYSLWDDNKHKTVYVNTMKELKDEINKFNREGF